MCHTRNFFYITMMDNSTRQKDFVHISVDSRKPYMNMYGGIYTSVSGVLKVPYSSAAVLENREHQLTVEERGNPYTTLDFMYNYVTQYVPKPGQKRMGQDTFNSATK